MKTILIPNATSPRNIGDLAILTESIKVLKSSFKQEVRIIIHSSEYQLQSPTIADEIKPDVFSWAVFENKSLISRIYRVCCLILVYLSIKYLGIRLNLNSTLNNLINNYLTSDILIFVGGGSLRSNKGLKQILYLIGILIIFDLANISKAKKIVLPVSFGPFYYSWQKNWAAKILSKFDLVSLRENFSYRFAKENNLKKIIESTDFALLNKFKKFRKKPTIGFTIRNWFGANKQQKLEEAYVESLKQLASEYNLSITPIVHVYFPENSREDDYRAILRVYNGLKKMNCEVNKPLILRSLNQSRKIYGSLETLLGMRLHSSIIAATCGTPFVALSYEYKTEGILQNLGVKKYSLQAELVTDSNLYQLIREVFIKRKFLANLLENNLELIRNREIVRWNSIFSSFNF